VCLLSTSAYSALEVLHIMRYINLLTYLLTYLLLEMATWESVGHVTDYVTWPWPQNVLCTVSPKRLEIQTSLQWSTYRIWGMAIQMVTWPMTSRDPERSRWWPHYVWWPLSRKRLEIQTWLQWSTYRKWGMAGRMVWCSMSSRVKVFLFGTDYILSLHFHNR